LKKNLQGDVSKLHRFKLRINDAPRRKFMTFLGGSCYAELTADTPDSWMTKAQFDEGGEALVTRMFTSSM
jgi:actin-related protein 2